MAGKKQESVSDFEILVPLESDLPGRLRKVSEATGLADCELLEKWLTQEESNLHTLRYYAEKQSRLKHDSPDVPGDVLEQPLEIQKQQAQEESEESPGSDSGQDYRQTLSQKIQDMREEGMTYAKIAAQFNEEGVATISGTGKWYPSTISQLLAAF